MEPKNLALATLLAFVAAGCQSSSKASEPRANEASTATVEVPAETEPRRESGFGPAPKVYRPEYHPAARGYIDRMESGLKPLNAISSLPGYEPQDAPVEEAAPAQPVSTSDADDAEAQPREPWLRAQDTTPSGYRPEYHPETRRYIREIEAGLKPIAPITGASGSSRGERGVS